MPTAQLKSIAEIINIAKISQVLAANNVAGDKSKFGDAPDPNIHKTIYMTRKSVEFLYEFFPSDSATRTAADYLYALCFPYNKEAERIISDLGQNPPVVTGPNDATVASGSTASFTITVSSALPYTIEWYKNGVIVAGETGLTYSFTASIGDTGAIITARAVNTAGATLSRNAILTVTTALVGKFYVGDTDYQPNLAIGFDNVVWTGDFNIAGVGQPLQIQLPTGGDLGNNRYHVYRYPKTLGLYNGAWSGGAQNFGQAIPDQAWLEIIEIGEYKYIISRGQISVDIAAGMEFNLGS